MDEQHTQPTIETLMQMMSASQAEMREGFRQVGGRFDVLEKEMRDGFRKLERKQDVLNQSILEISCDFR